MVPTMCGGPEDIGATCCLDGFPAGPQGCGLLHGRRRCCGHQDGADDPGGIQEDRGQDVGDGAAESSGGRAGARESKSDYLKRWRQKNKDKISEQNRRYHRQHRDEIAEKQREYYKKRKDELNAEKKLWRLKNIERCRDRDRQYYLDHRDERLEWQKTYADRHRDEIARYQQAYRIAHPEKTVNHNAKRRTAIGDGELSKQQWLNLMRSIGWRCFYCGCPVFTSAVRTIDHVVPLSLGGPHHVGNLVPACRKCNLSKHDRYPHQWKSMPIVSRAKATRLWAMTLANTLLVDIVFGGQP
jgi:5-methylcytosine-specific restriction endonuclease McrA